MAAAMASRIIVMILLTRQPAIFLATMTPMIISARMAI